MAEGSGAHVLAESSFSTALSEKALFPILCLLEETELCSSDKHTANGDLLNHKDLF